MLLDNDLVGLRTIWVRVYGLVKFRIGYQECLGLEPNLMGIFVRDDK